MLLGNLSQSWVAETNESSPSQKRRLLDLTVPGNFDEYGFVLPHQVAISVLTAIIQESSDKQLVLRIVKALPFIHQPNRVVLKASDVSEADWLYQHTFLICELLYFPRLWPSLV